MRPVLRYFAVTWQHWFCRLILRHCPAKKEGGREGYQSNRFYFLHHRWYFFLTLKGLIFWFKSQKTDFNVQGQKRWNLFWYGFRYQKLSGTLRHCATFIGSDRRRITWKLLWWDGLANRGPGFGPIRAMFQNLKILWRNVFLLFCHLCTSSQIIMSRNPAYAHCSYANFSSYPILILYRVSHIGPSTINIFIMCRKIFATLCPYLMVHYSAM